jgi:DNA-binding response OmpR family regulator
MKILVVDDDKVLLEAIAYTLASDGYEVKTADDGFQALDIIQKQEQLDLIISDIMMPNMTGMGLLSLLKKFYFDSVPVILMSTLDKKEIILSAMKLGAYDFILKPFNIEELALRVKKVLNKDTSEEPSGNESASSKSD